MRRPVTFLLPAVGLGIFLLSALHPADATLQAPDFEKQVKPVLATYCSACHTGKTPSGGINPIQYRTMADVQKASKEFERVLAALRTGTMPPAGAKQPTANERKKLIVDL